MTETVADIARRRAIAAEIETEYLAEWQRTQPMKRTGERLAEWSAEARAWRLLEQEEGKP